MSDSDDWTHASRALLSKVIGELSFEAILSPEPVGDGYELRFPRAVYTFAARRTAFGGWQVKPLSVRRRAAGILGDDVAEDAVDVQQFLTDAAPAAGVQPATLAGYLAELTATLTADVTIARTARPVAELVDLDHTELEGHLTGHPWLVANKGRIGFGAADLAAYAPESRRRLRLPWLAAHRGLAEFRGTSELSEAAVRAHELDPVTVEAFTAALADRGLDPGAYVWLPVHPWQLDHVVRTLWAPELATARLVELGEAPDEQLPTQSIRTMSNMDNRDRFQVKLPLRILNTAVWRGIPVHCSRSAPVLSQWLRGIWERDEHLVSWGTVLLGEVASVTVEHPRLSTVESVPYPWLETLGCIWREPLGPRLRADEQAWPLAAVLHRDPSGAALVTEYLRGSDAQAWFAALLRALLRPLLNLLYRYGITVNPHGENVLIVQGPDGLPARAAIKDLIDDVNVSIERVPERGPEPDAHDRVLPRKPWRILRQYLVDALFVGVFRPLAPLLAEHGLIEDRFWGMVRGEIEAYRRRYPDLTTRMAAGDLLTPTFARYALNGDRLLRTGYAELPMRHAIAPTGEIPNPLHPVRGVEPPDGW